MSEREKAHAVTIVAVDYCNTVEWFENTDDVAGDIFGGRTSITAPILVDWSRGEDGPDWRLAEDGPIE